MRREEAIKEVEHLQRLNHAHILRVVGTYIIDRNLCILLYPVAEYNLDLFMESIYDDHVLQNSEQSGQLAEPEYLSKLRSLLAFFECLARALHYIHCNITKHMDIKPKNLLVRDMRRSTSAHPFPYKVYIADFGIARSYPCSADAETEMPTSFTRIYAAREVVRQEKRGFGADMFSLGRVYTEMLAVIADKGDRRWSGERQRLIDIRKANKRRDRSYQANISAVREFVLGLQLDIHNIVLQIFRSFTIKMLDKNPSRRPSAGDLSAGLWGVPKCCAAGADKFEPAVNIALEGAIPISAISKK